jgi:30S ribosomal protein S31
MGKGDKKSKRGKINRGTFGKRRIRKTKKHVSTPVTEENKKKIEVKTEEPKPELKTEMKKTTRKKKEKTGSDKENSAKQE